MRHALFLASLAALILTACGEQTNPPTQPAEPVDTAPAINPTRPVTPGQGPASFVGEWAREVSWCANSAASTDQVPIRITAERFEGYENSCAITGIVENADSYDVGLSCEAEGATTEEQVNLRVRQDVLTLTYPQRGGEPVQLVRCGADGEE